MDENNLDSLLDELSSMDGELNENIDIDSGVDVDADDMDDISLDELDHLDGMDLGDLDFDDIDFDDVDITKLDAGANPVVKKKPQEQETDDMSLDALIEKANQENVKPEPSQEEPSAQADNTDVFGEADWKIPRCQRACSMMLCLVRWIWECQKNQNCQRRKKIHIRQMRMAWMHCCSPLWQKVC